MQHGIALAPACGAGTGAAGGGAGLDGGLVAHHVGRVLPPLFLILYPTSDAVLAVALGRYSDRSVLDSDTSAMDRDRSAIDGDSLHPKALTTMLCWLWPGCYSDRLAVDSDGSLSTSKLGWGGWQAGIDSTP